jgi:hypothetical protein
LIIYAPNNYQNPAGLKLRKIKKAYNCIEKDDALIKNKIKFSSYIRKPEGSSCKVIYGEGLPNI